MRTYTALYDNRDEAEAAQTRLQGLGILDADGYGITDQSSEGFSGDASTGGGDNRSFWDKLMGAAPPREDRHLYEEHVRRGGYLLTVNVDEQNADRVRDELEGSGAVDVDERERQYRESGYTAGAVDQTGDIELVEERLNVGKREVERGTARIRSYVVETPVQEQVTLRSEHAEIERHAVDRPLSAADTANAFQEKVIEVRETAEVPVVEKQAFVREEIGIRKEVDERVETVSDTVRRTEVDFDRSPELGERASFTATDDLSDVDLTEEERVRRSDPSYRPTTGV